MVFPYLRTEMSHLSTSTQIRHCLCMARRPFPPPINNISQFLSFHRFSPTSSFFDACFFPIKKSLEIFISQACFHQTGYFMRKSFDYQGKIHTSNIKLKKVMKIKICKFKPKFIKIKKSVRHWLSLIISIVWEEKGRGYWSQSYY